MSIGTISIMVIFVQLEASGRLDKFCLGQIFRVASAQPQPSLLGRLFNLLFLPKQLHINQLIAIMAITANKFTKSFTCVKHQF